MRHSAGGSLLGLGIVERCSSVRLSLADCSSNSIVSLIAAMLNTIHVFCCSSGSVGMKAVLTRGGTAWSKALDSLHGLLVISREAHTCFGSVWHLFQLSRLVLLCIGDH